MSIGNGLNKQSFDSTSKAGNNVSGFPLEKQLTRSFLKEELSRMKELSEVAYKEGISKLLEMTRQGHKIPSLARNQLEKSTNSIPRSKRQLPTLKAHSKNLPKMNADSPITRYTEENSKLTHLQSSRSSPSLQPLFSVPNCVSKVGFKSKVGTIKGKPKLHNQDSIIIKPNLQNIKGQYLFWICDWHGAQGHPISDHCKSQFPSSIEVFLPFDAKPEEISKSLISATEKVVSSLETLGIDLVFSGCTVINLVISGNSCICANLGDSRAYIGRQEEKWQAIPLSSEHTLQNSAERERMTANNARIVKDTNSNGEETEKFFMGNQNVPGLEITRSLGDKIGKFVGMISIPETKTIILENNDKFIIIGSFGFWKFITGTEAVGIVRYSWENNKIDQACEDLVTEARRRWVNTGLDKEDITVVVVFLNVPYSFVPN